MGSIREALIPKGHKNRPETQCVCEFITIHETDNTAKGANAAAHASYIKSTAAGTTSWHYTVDDREAIRHIPDREVANHTGTLEGNKRSIGIEICVNADGDFARAVDNAARLTRQLMKQHRILPEQVVQHHHWNGKDCPRRLRADGWADFIHALEEEEDEEMKHYQTRDECPDWAKPTVDKLLQRDILRGTDTGLNLSEDMLRLLVLHDRAGVYDNPPDRADQNRGPMDRQDRTEEPGPA